MSEQSTIARPFFQPRPEHDNLNVAYFLGRFAERIEVSPTGCWVWTGPTVGAGYGRVSLGGRHQLAHRLIFNLCVEHVTKGDEVCHNCPGGDNPACCNPAHLWRGTHTENMRDSERKGRNPHRAQKGEEKPQSKLTDSAVRDIRRRATSGGWGIKTQLAIEYGVSKACISQAISGSRWAHVVDEPEGGAA